MTVTATTVPLAQVERFLAADGGPGRLAGFSPFYSAAFLAAYERSPLLPVEETRYVGVLDGDALVAYCPAYVQKIDAFDPFAAVLTPDDPDRARLRALLVSHVMHVSDTGVPRLAGADAAAVLEACLDRAVALAAELGADGVCFANVSDPGLRAAARAAGFRERAMWNRYTLDLTGIASVEQWVEGLQRRGRQELRRQLRKFAAAEGASSWCAHPDARLAALAAEFCHGTTARHGTADYYPRREFGRLVTALGPAADVLVVEGGGGVAGVGVALADATSAHFWALGVQYGRADFSPYAVLFADVVALAIRRGLERVEAGRTTDAIKQRMGFAAVPLYCLIRPLA